MESHDPPAPPAPQPLPRKRPAAVVIIVALDIFVSLYLLWLVWSIQSDRLTHGQTLSDLWVLWLWPVQAGFNLIIAVGLWLLREWARRAAIVLYLISAVSNVLVLFADGFSLGIIFGIVGPLAFMRVLMNEDVRETFH